MAVSWYCLCIDVTDPATAGFWAEVLGATHRPGTTEGDPGALIGPDGVLAELELVPEPKTVKNRVHLDVHAGSIEELTALGATVQVPSEESGLSWTVMEDPEGGEFCAFLRDDPPAFRLFEICVDAADPELVARWWGERFGVDPEREGDGSWWSLEGVPGMPFRWMVFNAVPEPKTVKNRIHWDVRGDVAELEAAGARVVAVRSRWTVMADPEGNEFCVFPPTGADAAD